MPSDREVIIEVVRRKLSRDVLQSQSMHARLVASVEAEYVDRPLFTTKNIVLSAGTRFFIPWSDKMRKISITLLMIDGALTTFLGAGVFDNFNTKDAVAVCDIFHNSQDRIGKLFYHSVISKTYDDKDSGDGPSKNRRRRHVEYDEIGRRDVQPEFRFRKLGRPVNWDRIRSINLDRVTRTTDTSLLMTCLDDVAVGDVSQEDVDPRLYHTMQLAQYSCQYMLSCQELLKNKAKLIQKALGSFEREEDELDLQLAKLRSRNKALERETEDIDDLQLQYVSLLELLNPPAAATFRDEATRRRAEGRRRLKKEKRSMEERSSEHKSNGHRGTAAGAEAARRMSVSGSSAKKMSGRVRQKQQGQQVEELRRESRDVVKENTTVQYRDDVDDGRSVRDRRGDIGRSLDQQPVRAAAALSRNPVSGDIVSGEGDHEPIGSRASSEWTAAALSGMIPAQKGRSGIGTVESTELSNLRTGGSDDRRCEAELKPWECGNVGLDYESSDAQSPSVAPLSRGQEGVDKAAGPALRRISSREFRNVQSQGVDGIMSDRSPSPALMSHYTVDSPATDRTTVAPLGTAVETTAKDAHRSAPAVATAVMPAPSSRPTTSPEGLPGGSSCVYASSLDAPLRALVTEDVVNPTKGPLTPLVTQELVVSSAADSRSDGKLMPPPLVMPMRESQSRQSTIRLSQTGNMSVDSLGTNVLAHGSTDDGGQGGCEMSLNKDEYRIGHSHGTLTHRGECPGRQHNISLSTDMLEEHDELFERSDADFSLSLSVSQAPAGSAKRPQGVSVISVPAVGNGDDDIKDFSMNLDDSVASEMPTSPAPVTMRDGGEYKPEAGGDVGHGSGDMVILSPDISFDQHDRKSVTPHRSRADESQDDNDPNKGNDAHFEVGEEVEALFRGSWQRGSILQVHPHGVYDIHLAGEGRSVSKVQGVDALDIRSITPAGNNLHSPGAATIGRALKSDVVNFLHHVRTSPEIHDLGDEESVGAGLGDTGDRQSFGSNSEGDDVLIGTNRMHAYGDTISSADSPVQSSPSKSRTQTPSVNTDALAPFAGDDIAMGGDGDQREASISGESGKAAITWTLGRAPVELVETGYALDVFVSAVRFDASSYDAPPSISLQLEFLGELSPPSKPVQTSLRMSVLPVSFAAHITFNREACLLLADEIASKAEDLSLLIHIVRSASPGKAAKEIADAEVSLWVMIEDSCGIVRQEIDVCETEMGACVGSAVVDVRGHFLLSKCS